MSFDDTGIFCEEPNRIGKPRNFVHSGENEVREHLWNICLSYNNRPSFVINNAFVQHLQQNNANLATKNYKSRDQFTAITTNGHSPETVAIIEILQNFPYKVVSSVYGCNHDFKDTTTANLAWNFNLNYFYNNFNNYPQNIKDILLKFYTGVNIIDTKRLDKIWVNTQDEINDLLSSQNVIFPTIDREILRSSDEDDGSSADVQLIQQFLLSSGIDPKRIVWVVDIFKKWLDQVSPNHLDIGNTIAQIDGATSGLGGNLKVPENIFLECNQLSVGPIGFKILDGDTREIGIYVNNTDQIGQAACGASVTQITNYLSTIGVNLNSARSKTESVYGVQFIDDPSLQTKFGIKPNDVKKIVVEYVKAAGDQAPIDIIKNICRNNDALNAFGGYILMLCTGDLLAHQLAVSLGLPSFFISSNRMLINIPTSFISQDVVTPTINNFMNKIWEMQKFIELLPHLAQLLNEIITFFLYSTSTAILAYQFLLETKEYLNKMTTNIRKLTKAYELFISGIGTNGYIEQGFYQYIEQHMNEISFVPFQLYDFIIGSKDINEPIIVYKIHNKSQTIIQEYYNLNPDTSKKAPKTSFCDNVETPNCYASGKCNTPIIDNVPNYVTNKCTTSNDVNNCIKYYGDNIATSLTSCNIQDVTTKVNLKNSLQLADDDGELLENWLLIGFCVMITYDKNTNNSFNISPDGRIIPKILPVDVYVPLSILKSVANNYTITDLYSEIPISAILSLQIFDLKGALINPNLFYNMLKYLIKTIQYILTSINVADSLLISMIEFTIIGFTKCFNQTIGSDNEIDTSAPIIQKIGRVKNIIQSLNPTQEKEYIEHFLGILYAHNVESIIQTVVQTNDDEIFKNLNLSVFISNNPTNGQQVDIHSCVTTFKQQCENVIYQRYKTYNDLLRSNFIEEGTIINNAIVTLTNDGVTSQSQTSVLYNSLVTNTIQGGYKKNKKTKTRKIQKTKNTKTKNKNTKTKNKNPKPTNKY